MAVATRHRTWPPGLHSHQSCRPDRTAKAAGCFSRRLPKPQTDLDRQVLKGIAITTADNTNGKWRYKVRRLARYRRGERQLACFETCDDSVRAEPGIHRHGTISTRPGIKRQAKRVNGLTRMIPD